MSRPTAMAVHDDRSTKAQLMCDKGLIKLVHSSRLRFVARAITTACCSKVASDYKYDQDRLRNDSDKQHSGYPVLTESIIE